MQRVLGVALALAAISACIPDTTSGSSGTPSSGGLGGDAGDASSIPADRAALCASYANATAQCCAQAPGTCTTTSTDDWRKHCESYASTCPAMPTCFSGGDCNTLIYCSGGC